MAASRARWLVTASRTERGGKAEPALLKWTTLATPGVSDLSNGTSSVICSFLNPEQSGERWLARWPRRTPQDRPVVDGSKPASGPAPQAVTVVDRKSTRLNSSHGYISYAVFCLKKKINAARHYGSAQAR